MGFVSVQSFQKRAEEFRVVNMFDAGPFNFSRSCLERSGDPDLSVKIFDLEAWAPEATPLASRNRTKLHDPSEVRLFLE